jgi:betaine-homocysteine S-methyltransferase
MFREQVQWAAEEGVDFIIAETIGHLGEALLAVQAIKEFKLPAVVTLCIHREERLRDGYEIEEAYQKLKQAGADVVGINCHRGPHTINHLLKRIRAAVEGPIAALPVPYRTTPEQPSFFTLKDPNNPIPHERAFPTGKKEEEEEEEEEALFYATQQQLLGKKKL